MKSDHKCDLCPKSKFIPQDDLVYLYGDHHPYSTLHYGEVGKKPVVFTDIKEFPKGKISSVCQLKLIRMCKNHAELVDALIPDELLPEGRPIWSDHNVETQTNEDISTVRRKSSGAAGPSELDEESESRAIEQGEDNE